MGMGSTWRLGFAMSDDVKKVSASVQVDLYLQQLTPQRPHGWLIGFLSERPCGATSEPSSALLVSRPSIPVWEVVKV